jgi:hypothetical protein
MGLLSLNKLGHRVAAAARRADGTGVVIDVRPGQRIGERDEAVFAATARVCAQVACTGRTWRR